MATKGTSKSTSTGSASKSVATTSKTSSAPLSNTVVTNRSASEEASALALGYTAAQIAARGGINSQGYWNDTPVNAQLTAAERASVTLSNGTINTQAMLDILNAKSGTTSYGSGGGSNLVSTTPASSVSSMIASSVPVVPVKTAPLDTILFNDSAVPIEVITDLLFEDIGGQELINIARNDTVNGQEISYQPIKNLSSIQQQYNPNNILSVSATSNRFFAGFPIKLEDKIPSVGNGTNGTNVYLDGSNGSITIDLVNLASDEQVEIQINVDGTIYEAEL